MVEADSDLGSEELGFVPFAQRKGLWDDVEPIEQYEGGQAPLCAIQYHP